MKPSEQIDIDDSRIGRFDRSFLILMIRDFFVILLIVTVIEFAIKAAMVYYDFATEGEDQARTVADDIAGHVRSIMLNDGGPVAARTLYPILEENWNALGYRIAIEPAQITVEAIEEGFGFVPQGIPGNDWPEGRYKSANVEITAEEFCLNCHTTAQVGDVLGTVTVRNYLWKDFVLWWRDVQLSGGLAIGKILLHSILLFILLRVRMEPLLRLRSVVGNLAKAYGGLHYRAEIRSSDEFGVLARDLNLFLDRIGLLVEELDQVLRKVVAVNDDIITIQSGLREKVDQVAANTRQLERRAMLSAKREPLLSDEWFDAVRGSIADLDSALEKAGNAPNAAPLLGTLRAVVANAESQIRTNEVLFSELASLGEDTEAFQSAIAEMARLEERMKAIIETGSVLVGRLRPAAESADR